MPLSPEQTNRLQQPLPASAVAKRQAGKGRMVSYIEGFTAINTANEVFGFGGWGMTVDDLVFHAMSSGGFYRATVTVTVTGCEPQQDVGACVATNDSAEQHDMALKGAVTDAMKRALRHYGAAFGNDLYDKDAPEPAASTPPQRQTVPASSPGRPSVPASSPQRSTVPAGAQAAPAPMTADTWLEATLKAKEKLVGKQPPYPAVMADWLRVHIGRGQDLAPGILRTEPALMTDDVLAINLDTLEQAILRQQAGATTQQAVL